MAPQDNVALIVVLDATAGQGQEKPADAPRRQLICVANTHIHANPELNDVKLWQVSTSLSTISAAQDISLSDLSLVLVVLGASRKQS